MLRQRFPIFISARNDFITIFINKAIAIIRFYSKGEMDIMTYFGKTDRFIDNTIFIEKEIIVFIIKCSVIIIGIFRKFQSAFSPIADIILVWSENNIRTFSLIFRHNLSCQGFFRHSCKYPWLKFVV